MCTILSRQFNTFDRITPFLVGLAHHNFVADPADIPEHPQNEDITRIPLVHYTTRSDNHPDLLLANLLGELRLQLRPPHLSLQPDIVNRRIFMEIILREIEDTIKQRIDQAISNGEIPRNPHMDVHASAEERPAHTSDTMEIALPQSTVSIETILARMAHQMNNYLSAYGDPQGNSQSAASSSAAQPSASSGVPPTPSAPLPNVPNSQTGDD